MIEEVQTKDTNCGDSLGRAACGRPTLDRGFSLDNAEREPGISRQNMYNDKIQ